MAVLTLLDRTAIQYNLERGQFIVPGMGAQLCRYSVDMVGFLKNLVSRIVTYLDAIAEVELGLGKEEEPVGDSKQETSTPGPDGNLPPAETMQDAVSPTATDARLPTGKLLRPITSAGSCIEAWCRPRARFQTPV